MAYPSGYIPLGEVKPCLALGCCAASLYCTDSEDFLGCVTRNTLCCLRNEVLICKPSRKADACCHCLSMDCELVHFGTLVKTQSQCLCADLRIAIPPDTTDAPCLWTLFFWTCFYKDHFVCKCCVKTKAMEPLPTAAFVYRSEGAQAHTYP